MFIRLSLASAWTLQGIGSLRRAVWVSGQLPRVIPSLGMVVQRSEGVRMECLSVPGHGGTERERDSRSGVCP